MFEDRTSAGEMLAQKLVELELTDPVVLALPRGGVPVAVPIARALQAPLDLVLVRKIGTPGNPELASGAVVEGADPVFNEPLLKALHLTPDDFAAAVARKRAEIRDRRQRFLGDQPPVSLQGRTAVVVDDGIATGSTVRAALRGLQDRNPGDIVVAVPVAPQDRLDELTETGVKVICLLCPERFWAVGAYFRDFRQVSVESVAEQLAAYSEIRRWQSAGSV